MPQIKVHRSKPPGAGSPATGIAVLKREAVQMGEDWNARTDGQSAPGGTPLNGQNSSLDAVQDMTCPTITIFQGEARPAANVGHSDEPRRKENKLTADTAYDAMLRDGPRYDGRAVTLRASCHGDGRARSGCSGSLAKSG